MSSNNYGVTIRILGVSSNNNFGIIKNLNVSSVSYGVSSGIIDGKVGTLIGVSSIHYLTRNETPIPTGFLTWGTTTTDRVINTSSNTSLNSNTIFTFQ